MATAKQVRFDFRIAALAAAAALAVALALASSPAAATEGEAEARLEQLIHEGLREGGPFFEADERAMIERKCGYAPGSWDGFDANISNGVFHCSNGRRLDDGETRAMIARAAPRIERRVDGVMRRPEIRAAISRIAEQAAAEALRELGERRGH